MPSALWPEQNAFKASNVVRRCGAQRQKRNDPPVSLPRRLRVEPVDQFFSCQVLQLLRLESSILEKVVFIFVASLQTAQEQRFEQKRLCP